MAYVKVTYKRKCRLYCVGAAKSGTHSIAGMFDQTIRSGHEPESKQIIDKIIGLSEGKLNSQEMSSYIRKRDNRLCLDVDSSQLNFFLIDYLLKEFPDAKYLLTIRDCYTWLDSFINHSLRDKAEAKWIMLRDFRFGADKYSHSEAEMILKRNGLYTLDGYLSYWANHNKKVLKTVPRNRLMVLDTLKISQHAYEIADFAGLPRSTIQIKNSHAFKNKQKFQILRQLPENYLEEKVQEYCEPIMREIFPHIKSINDTNL
nr:sulfotransferase [Halochromatium salexigens]